MPTPLLDCGSTWNRGPLLLSGWPGLTLALLKRIALLFRVHPLCQSQCAPSGRGSGTMPLTTTEHLNQQQACLCHSPLPPPAGVGCFQATPLFWDAALGVLLLPLEVEDRDSERSENRSPAEQEGYNTEKEQTTTPAPGPCRRLLEQHRCQEQEWKTTVCEQLGLTAQ